MSNSTETVTPSPWPGPIPYREDQARDFHGRREEIAELVDRMMGRVNILTAWSGAGKSSLIHAGLVPHIRDQRARGLGRFGPILVLSSWGALLGSDSPAWILASAMWREIQRVRDEVFPHAAARTKADFDALYSVGQPAGDGVPSSWDDLPGYARALCDKTGRLTIVIDQLEELLGSGEDSPDPELERRVLSVIGELYRTEPRVSLLLSLREEYLARLGVLNEYVEALDPRTFRLGAMQSQTAKDAIVEAARNSRSISLDDDAAELLIQWTEESKNVTRTKVQVGTAGHTEPPRKTFDLLGLQALLVGVIDWVASEYPSSDGAPVAINRSRLGRFSEVLRLESSKSVRPTSRLRRTSDSAGHDEGSEPPVARDVSLARMALLRYIERLFTDQPGKDFGLMRRLLGRMAPFLSGPGGYKRHIDETELVFNAIWPELQRIDISDDHAGVREELSKFRAVWSELRRDTPTESPAARRRSLDVTEAFRSELARRLTLAGFGLVFQGTGSAGPESGASPLALQGTAGQAAYLMIETGFRLIEYLRDQQVVKVGSSQGRFTCELAHDGMGSALTEWAERERGSFRDVYASVVSSGGESFRWDLVCGEPVDPITIEAKSWLGCLLDRVTFRHVVFRACVLKGTLFRECTFDNCSFVDCDLDGALFMQGTVGASGLTITGGSASSIVFAGVALGGGLTFSHTSLTFAQLYAFRPSTESVGGPLLQLDWCDLRNALVHDMDADWVRFVPAQQSTRRTGLISRL